MPDLITERVIYDGIQALNQSGAKELLKSPAHYQAYLARTREESKALRVGTAVHKLALEGLDAYNATHAIAPDVDKRTKEGKAEWAEFVTANEGKAILTADEGALVDAVSNAAIGCMKEHGIVLSKTEVMFTAFLGDTLVKCAIDGISDDGYIYDLKSAKTPALADSWLPAVSIITDCKITSTGTPSRPPTSAASLASASSPSRRSRPMRPPSMSWGRN